MMIVCEGQFNNKKINECELGNIIVKLLQYKHVM